MRSFLLKSLIVAGVVVFVSQNAMAGTETKSQASGATSSTQSSASTQETSAKADKAETLTITGDVLPAQVAMVSGDYHKYEALNWQNRGYSGGVKDLAIHYTSGDDITIDATGGAVMGNGDYKGTYSIKKKDVGYVDFDFKQFRKYYDTYGGIWNGHSDSLSRDLFLDIGHIGFEAGITMPDLPNVSVYYDHDYKKGSKSMLNWATSQRDGGGKKISPSWEEIDETVDTFGIKADHTHKGYHLTGDQRWEIARWKTRGYEVRLGNGSATASHYDQRRQDQVQETNVMTTTLGADKWYLSDKVFASSAYRFEHLKNQDRQNIQQFTKDGAPNLAGNINKPDGSAHNNQDRNSWVMNLMVSPWSWLSATSGFKAEVLQRDAESYYPTDTAGTIGVIDNNAKTNTDSNTYKFAESFGLRFKAIPRTAIYTDLSFEQSQNHLIVNRQGIAGAAAVTASDNQTRDAVINEPVINWVTGADFQPFRRINLTSQIRLCDKNMDFDDRFRIRPFEGQVFLERLHTRNIGFTQRATARLCSWSQTSFRYLFDDTDYISRAAYENVDQKAQMLSNTFIYDLSVYPVSNLSMTGSFTQRYDQTKTVEATAPAGETLVPAFNSNFSTWMFSAGYQPRDKVHFDGSLFYTLANNYASDKNSGLVNYASAYNQLGLSAGCKWDLNKDLSVKPMYSFSRYQPNENSGVGAAYDAHIVSISVSTKWG
jgi:hypothetical protein